MLASSARMQRLILDLLAYSRVSTRRHAYRPDGLERVGGGGDRRPGGADSADRWAGSRRAFADAPRGRLQMRQLLQNLIGNRA
jgi:signal transduction histidine kinase